MWAIGSERSAGPVQVGQRQWWRVAKWVRTGVVPAERPHNVRAGWTGPRTRRQPGRPSRSERTDRAGRRRGVRGITRVGQSAGQTGSAGPGSWMNSRSAAFRGACET